MPEAADFVAHKTDDNRVQARKEHLDAVSALAGEFADAFGAGGFARVIGKNHDVGKYSGKFQRRVRGENIKVDHSTAGGQLLY
ncbi:MAG: CRISPR-associated endonuclease Cas3'', partial [Oscillospiraceae bacterium]|nr:CRISPR-associated endonuclease Cas3'' [Oscillospiraceae bacterium]